MIKHGEEFQREAVRIALTSGLPRKRVAADLGIGLSTLTRWVSLHRGEGFPTSPDADLARENEQLRRENRILKEERDILKNHRGSVPPVGEKQLGAILWREGSGRWLFGGV
ncbi:hypothetical protein GCM10019059_44950 [Camelimonas fluminis]|nr:hypothetical protein GCM10019059_44950 [Camelimonas fluminis]